MAPSVDNVDVKPEGLRARKKQLQRNRLIDIGVELFITKGFDATSVSEIAALAELSDPTFYRYFKTKEDLAFDWNRKLGRIELTMLADRPKHEKPITSLKKTILALAGRWDSDPVTSAKMLRLIYSSPILESRALYETAQWEKSYATVLQQGRAVNNKECFRIEVDVAIVVAAFVAAARNWSKSDRRSSIKSWVAEALAEL